MHYDIGITYRHPYPRSRCTCRDPPRLQRVSSCCKKGEAITRVLPPYCTLTLGVLGGVLTLAKLSLPSHARTLIYVSCKGRRGDHGCYCSRFGYWESWVRGSCTAGRAQQHGLFVLLSLQLSLSLPLSLPACLPAPPSLSL
jgi:hypothetical protein